MLKKLYSKIEAEERKMMGISISKEDMKPAKWWEKIDHGEWFDVTTLGVPGEKAKLEENWYRVLYWDQKQNTIKIVGPVGERPLHVCALSAYRFGHVDFEGTGNYLSEGIVQGMMDYINEQSAVYQAAGNENEDRRREDTVQYGKDYCAAVGTFLLKNESHTWGKAPISRQKERNFPPFWAHICKWKRAHLRSRSLKLRNCCASVPLRYATSLVSSGIYEGETILFPLIAGKAEVAIHQLLSLDKERRHGVATPRYMRLARFGPGPARHGEPARCACAACLRCLPARGVHTC